MRFRLYREFGALNSKPVFDAFEKGLIKSGHTVDVDSDVDVIWSVLWKGRMKPNSEIYERNRKTNKPTIILEVGSLIRGTTWKVALNHINSLGFYGNETNLDEARPSKLGLTLKDNSIRNSKILLATQQPDSLQWQHQSSMKEWVADKIDEIRQYTDRIITVRPHPKFPVELTKRQSGVFLDIPKRLENTYDSFNIDYNYHCVVNHNSGPSIQSVINGTPVICDRTSLAYPMSSLITMIDNPILPNRAEWFVKITHTEWTLDEIADGIPIRRIL